MEENSTTNFTMNDTLYGSLDWEEFITDQCSSIPYTLIAFAGVCLGILLCGLAGNGMVIWFLGFHTKQSPFTVYILNLAVADFSLLLLFLLLLLAFLTFAAFCTTLLPFIHQYKHLVFVLGFLCHLFDLSSLGLLAALSVERCASALCPIWYRCHRPRHLSGVVSGALWALAGALVSSLYVTYTYTEDSEAILAAMESHIPSQANPFKGKHFMIHALTGLQERWRGTLDMGKEGQDKGEWLPTETGPLCPPPPGGGRVLLSYRAPAVPEFPFPAVSNLLVLGTVLMTGISSTRVMCTFCCRCNFPERLLWLVGSAQFWAFFALFTVIPALTNLCPPQQQEQCRAALISMYTLILLLFVAPLVISSTIKFFKARRGSKKQQPKRRDIVIFLVMLFILLLIVCHVLQQLSTLFCLLRFCSCSTASTAASNPSSTFGREVLEQLLLEVPPALPPEGL
ncbi:hypothetical protein DUI87_25531 [Hirundo rustica rustica]|uniref:G-protein coupled receptors family 1 profile domain-containing protein n=1 Tax=Hirundo rustica rustica TaxID=333673 RepID=A0A3M0JG74_HIRRU|nr:hypothetical protein DUI87_25531 [Hirundo rustica rustica]